MLWRLWKKKASLKILGRSVTPFGPEWLDRTIARGFGLKGDHIADFRLIDYLVALMATDESPALNGALSNQDRLKQDLGDMGVFDPCMPLYMLYRARCFETMGFTGYEGRHYSLFENLTRDMAHATNLQMLITCLAYKYIFTGHISHTDIPDHPFVESERRQIFFGAAVGIPTFYVRSDTPNRFLARLVKRSPNTRSSRRYTGYTRVRATDFRQTLTATLQDDAPELVEMGGFEDTLNDLRRRIDERSHHAVAERLTRRICELAGAVSSMVMSGDAFNAAAESFYRKQLKKEQMEEALEVWCEQVRQLDGLDAWRSGVYNQALLSILKGNDAVTFIGSLRPAVLAEDLPVSSLSRLIHLLLLTLDHMQRQSKETLTEARRH
jgi:hypothetical protein